MTPETIVGLWKVDKPATFFARFAAKKGHKINFLIMISWCIDSVGF